MSRWWVEADPDLCQGHQNCRLEAPDLFGFDPGTDRVVVLTGSPPDSLLPAARHAVTGCPSMALTLVEEAGDGT